LAKRRPSWAQSPRRVEGDDTVQAWRERLGCGCGTICAPFESALCVAYSSQITHGTLCTFHADFCFRTRVGRPSHVQRRAVLSVVKALSALDPAGCGLDDASAPLLNAWFDLPQPQGVGGVERPVTRRVNDRPAKLPAAPTKTARTMPTAAITSRIGGTSPGPTAAIVMTVPSVAPRA
jgi:hypothetical protein